MEPELPIDRSDDPELCAKCKGTMTIIHNGGRWCPLCGEFVTQPDFRETKHVQTRHRAQLSPVPIGGAARCSRCMQPVDVCSGVYDDGEWLCGHCVSTYTGGESD